MLYKDPDGANIFVAHDKTLGVQTTTSQHGRQASSEDVDTLKQRVKWLEDELTKHNVSDLMSSLTLYGTRSNQADPMEESVSWYLNK